VAHSKVLQSDLMATTAVKSLVLEDCARRSSLDYAARAAKRGFNHFMLCVNRRTADCAHLAEVPVLCVSTGTIEGIVREWSTTRHEQDPLRRMAARGQIDGYMAQPLLWENDAGRLSIPRASVGAAAMTDGELETMRWVYACGVHTGMNIRVPVVHRTYSVIASFFSDRSLADLTELEDTIAICHYLSHMIYHDLKDACGFERTAAPVRLSPREQECLGWVAKGKSATEIAIIISLSVETVRDHLKRVRTKLNASTRAQALMRAMELGLIANH
jgi:DNA-binding CsgD family transcriptional regulator